MSKDNDKEQGPRCSNGAVIGANYTIEDAEQDSLLPPPRIQWNIKRDGKEGPSMEYIRFDLAQPAVVDPQRIAEIRARQEQRRGFKQARPNPRWPDPEADIDYLIALSATLSAALVSVRECLTDLPQSLRDGEKPYVVGEILSALILEIDGVMNCDATAQSDNAITLHDLALRLG